MKNGDRAARLFALGLNSDLIDKIFSANYSITKLKTASKRDLEEFFTTEEIDLIANSLQRNPIPEETLLRLIQDCDSKCCMCWDYKKESPVIIHHIIKHSKTHDDSYENLVVLCLDHHAKAHSRWEISRSPYSPDVIKQKKLDWIKAIADFKTGRRPPPSSEPLQAATIINNLPPGPKLFVGRKEYIEIIKEQLINGNSIAIYGMGGVGKTAIAIKAFSTLNTYFTGGVLWGSFLESNGDPLFIIRLWYQILKKEVAVETDINNLSNLLRNEIRRYQMQNGSLLFIIDDIRSDWIDAARMVRNSIPDDGTLLITTREESLAIQFCHQTILLNEMQEGEAYNLFTLNSNQNLSGTEREEVNELLLSIGYLPLAIEILGNYFRLLKQKPGDRIRLLREKINRKSLLIADQRGHYGLNTTFVITYEALLDEEKKVFRWLSVFENLEFSLNQVAKISDIKFDVIEEQLDRLVDHGFLKWTNQINVYEMHPLLKDYSSILLIKDSNEFENAHKAHMLYFLEFVRETVKSNVTNNDILEKLLPEVIASVENAVRIKDHQVVINFADMLEIETNFLSTRGYYSDAVSLLNKGLSSCQALGQTFFKEARIRNSLGNLYNLLGETKNAIDSYQKALELSSMVDDKENISAVLGNLGHIYKASGRKDDAINCYKESLEIAYDLRAFGIVADQLGNLGSMFRHVDYYQAKKYYEAALEICRKQNDRLGEGNNLSNLGLILFDEQNYDVAYEMIKNALDIAIDIGDRKGEANRLGHLGNISFFKNEYEQAIQQFNRAVEINQQIGHKHNEAAWLANLGRAYLALEQQEKGIYFLEKSLRISEEIQNVENEVICLRNLGMVSESQFDWNKAKIYFNRAVSISFIENSPRHQIFDLEHLAKINTMLGNRKEVLDNYNQAILAAEKENDQLLLALRLNKYGADCFLLGEISQAIIYQGRALKISINRGDRELIGIIRIDLGVAQRSQGLLEEARNNFLEAEKIFRSSNKLSFLATVLTNLGVVSIYSGELERAKSYLLEAEMLNQEINDPANAALIAGNLGNIEYYKNRYEEAIPLHNRALIISRELDNIYEVANWLGALSQDYISMEKPDQAQTLLEEGIRICRETGNLQIELKLLQALGVIALDKDHYDQALEYFETVFELSKKIYDPYTESSSLYFQGIVWKRKNLINKARDIFSQALRISQTFNDTRREMAICWELGIMEEENNPESALNYFQVFLEYATKFSLPQDEVKAKIRDLKNQLAT